MTGDSPASVLRSTQAVLLDFDGPVCSVFAGYSAPQIAEELQALVRDVLGEIPAAIADADGPHEVLATSAQFGGDLWRRVEDALQVAEIKAGESATETLGIRSVLDACRASKRPVAIVSNNCEASIRVYLDHAGLGSLIQHIEARDPDYVDRMKPSPFLLDRATAQLGVEPSRSAFVGDQVSDIEAAIAARVRSVGYANKPGKAEDLGTAGADVVISDMRVLPQVLGLPASWFACLEQVNSSV